MNHDNLDDLIAEESSSLCTFLKGMFEIEGKDFFESYKDIYTITERLEKLIQERNAIQTRR